MTFGFNLKIFQVSNHQPMEGIWEVVEDSLVQAVPLGFGAIFQMELRMDLEFADNKVYINVTSDLFILIQKTR